MTLPIHPYYLSWQKKIFDRGLAFFLIILLSPVLLIISILIFLESGTPIIFSQKRMGKKKKTFTMYKFRTMMPNAEKWKPFVQKYNESVSPMFKIQNDPRLTTFGKHLSRTGLDEVPQLLNILRGEMSFVGPRPLPVEEARQLDTTWEYRFIVLPGIFSEWALSEKRHSSTLLWQQLEKDTLRNGGILYEIHIMYIYFKRLYSNILFLLKLR